jgi:hypothetical protein
MQSKLLWRIARSRIKLNIKFLLMKSNQPIVRKRFLLNKNFENA